jgi:hypothetical protein
MMKLDLLRFLMSGEAWAIEKEEVDISSSMGAVFWQWLCVLSRIIALVGAAF